MRFRHLRLGNWRNFVHVDVPLASRVFLAGPNASGKSNLLDALRFLHDIVAVGGGLRSAVARRGGLSGIRCLAARHRPDVLVDVMIGNGNGGGRARWRYRLGFGADDQRLPIVKEESVWDGDSPILSRPSAEDRKDPERLRQTHLEQTNANREFRSIAEFLGSVRYLHIVPQILRQGERSGGRSGDPFGGDFLERIASTPPRTRAARLRKILHALEAAVPQMRDLEVWRDKHGTPHLRGRYEHWRHNAGWQTEDQFSDGTLRLLGLLWALLDGHGPLLLEEPELSLHTEVVRRISGIFAGIQRSRPRQIVVSTHSADLLSDEGIGGDEVLLLRPSAEGTTVTAASADRQIRDLLEGGASVADAVLPATAAEDASQLALFGE